MLVLCPVLGSRFVIVIELCYCIRAGKAERRTKMEAVGGGGRGRGWGGRRVFLPATAYLLPTEIKEKQYISHY